jgi:Immunoglobulin I-set domain
LWALVFAVFHVDVFNSIAPPLSAESTTQLQIDTPGNADEDDETEQHELENLHLNFTKQDQLKKSISEWSGKTVQLDCNVTGNPLPNITWTKDGGMIVRPYEKEVLYRKYTIILEDVAPTDSGDYECKVCNKLGCINYTTEVVVSSEFNYSKSDSW